MHGMNYRIPLPADYDMGIIRHRVATRGHLLDEFPGLGQKAYLIRERGTDGSPVNEYAPFYLWNTPQGMNGFLWGPGFRGLVEDFGRPTVEHWTVLGFERGPAVASPPSAAVRAARRLGADEDPAAAFARELDGLRETAAHADLHSAALLVDPRHWEVLRFTLWRGAAPDEPDGERFQVLHLSRPELDSLPTGRQW
ncbi:protein of unknown function [Actinacidiphila yanglinensis]|uniref:DUF4865 domain-containing protein n=1 Tax=Actinacidiphila yanglinensis TaxID=310779 RepID=A0A1H6DZF2_9ACTN|nr:DUF4865 family protein [Actinacidiphila yanglinensis]SEG90213.1 protein of unknown function [Actinacidiphila yanglinensis]